jgi:hypothetical protein
MASHIDPSIDSGPTSEQQTEARQVFSQAAYGPEQLKLICDAFDQAWEAIRPVVDDNPLAHEAARLKLANMILGIASSQKLGQARAGLSAPANSDERSMSGQ